MCGPRAVTLLPRSICVSQKGVAIFHPFYGRTLLFHRFACASYPSISRVYGGCSQNLGHVDCNANPVPDGKGWCSHTHFLFSDAIQDLNRRIFMNALNCFWGLIWTANDDGSAILPLFYNFHHNMQLYTTKDIIQANCDCSHVTIMYHQHRCE